VDRLTSFIRKVPRAVELALQLARSRASVEHTLAAHRFLKAIGYRGQARGREALREFCASGYTFDDLLMTFAFLRMYGGGAADANRTPEQVARASLRFTGWNASEECKHLETLSPELDRANFCEDLLLGECTLVIGATALVAAQACELLRENEVGGAVLPLGAAPVTSEWKACVQNLARVRQALAQAGLAAPRLSLVVVGSDPIRACVSEWEANSDKRAEDFSAALAQAAAGDTTSPLFESLRAATDEKALMASAEELAGIPAGGLSNMCVDPAKGFVAQEGELARVHLTCFESLHLLALELRAGGEPGAELMSFRPSPKPSSRSGMAAEVECPLPVAQEVSHRSTAENFHQPEERAAWVRKWSEPSGAATRGDGLVYVFPHIPKTAGSSVAHHFREHLSAPGEFAHVRHGTDAAGIRRDRIVPFQWRDARLRAQTRMIFGHGVKRRFCDMVPGKAPREIITLREPAERMISHYNFWMHIRERRGLPVISFDEWYRTEPRDYQIFWIAFNYLELDFWLYSPGDGLHDLVDSALEEFWMVSTLETFTKDMQVLMKELALPEIAERKNVGGGVRFPKRVSLTDDLRARLREENPSEYRLYDKWLERARARYA
jgi:hypothetical protein